MSEILRPSEANRTVDDLVKKVASKLHDAWREPRRIEGTDKFEPRIKPVKDEQWPLRHNGQTEIDIANTSYENLPAPWQAENKAAAQSAVNAILKAQTHSTPLNEDFIEFASNQQHQDWLLRNGEWAPQEQKLPYNQLPESEKEKDRVVVRTALDIYLKN